MIGQAASQNTLPRIDADERGSRLEKLGDHESSASDGFIVSYRRSSSSSFFSLENLAISMSM